MFRLTSGRDRTDRARWAPGVSPYGPPPARPEAWPAPKETSPTGVGAVALALVAIPLGFVGFFVWMLVGFFRGLRADLRGWSTKREWESLAKPTVHAPVPPPRARDLDAIRATDPLFSVALFEDFMHALYTEVRVAHGQRKLERVAPYLAPSVRSSLAGQESPPVGQVVIGAIRCLEVDTSDPLQIRVQIEIEANYAELGGATSATPTEQAFWVSERWWLARARTARSRSPERARVLDCPGCGAPIDKVVGGQCRHCRQVVDTGAFDWRVTSIEVDHKEPRGPMLTGTTEEQGTELPTVFDPWLSRRLAALQSRDRAFDVAAFQRRIGLVFATMQIAWSSLEWNRARPFLSDNLFEAQRYWIEAYRRSGLRNVTERARIERIELVRVLEDAYFDAITVRVHATGLDYTVRVGDGAVVGGNRDKERRYTEYWTLLRGNRVTGPTRTEPVCPRCGAPLQVSMAAECGACRAKVNSGAFDWVLARIEQDEAYTG